MSGPIHSITKFDDTGWHQLRLDVRLIRRKSRRVIAIRFGPVSLELRAGHAERLVDLVHDLLDEDRKRDLSGVDA